MGFFDRLAKGLSGAVGAADPALLRDGRLGRGQVLQVVPSGGTVQIGGGFEERICDLQIRVLLDDTVPYVAAVHQRFPEPYLTQLPGNFVAIRVDPQDPQRVALDMNNVPPSVRIARVEGAGGAADILAHGTDAVVIMQSSEDCGYQDYRGWEMYRWEVTVVEGAPTPYRMQCGNAVPPESLGLVYPGSRLHAKIGAQPHMVVVDFSRGAVS